MTLSKLSIGVAALLATGCTADKAELQVRSLGTSTSETDAAGDLAQGFAQLSLGNAGLALQAFRAAERTRPGNVRALAGLAVSYQQMGRFDLARRYFEEALALAPRDRMLLTELADSLAAEGDTKGAAALRTEIANLGNPAAATPAQAASSSVTLSMPVMGSAASPRSAQTLSTSVTVVLPPVIPLAQTQQSAVGTTVIVKLPPAVKSSEPPMKRAKTEAQASAPRLERLSLGEVALISSGSVQWGSPKSAAARAQTTAMALKPSRNAGTVLLLNAARRQGLAARTRDYLAQRGWSRLLIGDAPRTQPRSLVLYPIARKSEALRLAARFGFTSRLRSAGGDILILLGRDAAAQEAAHKRG